jgi:hypothetical protein
MGEGRGKKREERGERRERKPKSKRRGIAEQG